MHSFASIEVIKEYLNFEQSVNFINNLKKTIYFTAQGNE